MLPEVGTLWKACCGYFFVQVQTVHFNIKDSCSFVSNILPTDVVPARYKQSISEGWNSLCLCPNCAAEFKFGKKNLSGLISMIQNYYVKEQDENLIVCDIEMQGKKEA